METQNEMIVIQILGSDPSTGNLTMSDNGHSDVSRGDQVTWIVHPNSGVNSLTGITVKTGSTNVFGTGPCPIGNSSNWRGKILDTLIIPIDEDYNIYWDDTTGTNHCYDPKLTVNN